LIDELAGCIKKFFGEDPGADDNYGRIINQKQFDRLINYMSEGKIVIGGRQNRNLLYIEPTVLTDVPVNRALMKDEIFGPLLPIISFEKDEEAVDIIKKNPDPLALYVFTSSERKEKFWMSNVAFGGGCINNASWHLTNHYLPFGGRGMSGMGSYHGRQSFDTFSHHKAVMKTPYWFDPAIKYPPFKGKLGLFKRIVK
jgi:aldehyde dehydrogenase (NAD+)